MRKNIIICPNCSSENVFYVYTCKKCNSFLRSKVANIDFWETVWNMLVSPVKTSEIVIFSEHKNFLVTMLLFIIFKFSTVNYIVKNAMSGEEFNSDFKTSFLVGGLFTVALLILFSFLITYSNRIIKVQSRVIDNLSLFAYSFIPIFVSSLFLFPVQLALYGFYWFSYNPSPLVIKPTVTYILYFIELLFFLWTYILFITSVYTQSRTISYSIVSATVLFCLLLSLHFL